MLPPDNRRRYAAYIGGYAVAFTAMYGLLFVLGKVSQLPSADSLVSWDAVYYQSIAEQGYRYSGGRTANAGFFPLFPYIWKLTGLGGVGVSLLNAGIYIGSLWWLCILLRPRPITLGLFCALPFLFFMYIPLSEAWFFAAATLVLHGIVRKQQRIIFLGLLAAGLARPTFLFLIPALVGAELLIKPKRAARTDTMWWTILIWYALPTTLAIGVVALVQYIQIGEPFAYYETQSEGWGRQFGLPVFPLAGGREGLIPYLRDVNLWIGVLASGFGLTYLFRWLLRDRLPPSVQQIDLVAIIYLCMCLVSIVFFNPEWSYASGGGYHATTLTGINRYIQANPFLLVFFVHVFDRPPTSRRFLLPLFVGTYLLWFAIDLRYYAHIQRLLSVSYVTLLLLPYWLFYFVRWKPIGVALVIASLYLQCVMLDNFMSDVQVD
ncbi:MAG: hypothetical protein WA952_19065 [Lewinella sp.]